MTAPKTITLLLLTSFVPKLDNFPSQSWARGVLLLLARRIDGDGRQTENLNGVDSRSSEVSSFSDGFINGELGVPSIEHCLYYSCCRTTQHQQRSRCSTAATAPQHVHSQLRDDEMIDDLSATRLLGS